MKTINLVGLLLLLCSFIPCDVLGKDKDQIFRVPVRNPFKYTSEILNYLEERREGELNFDPGWLAITGIMQVNEGRMAVLEIRGSETMPVKKGMKIDLKTKGGQTYVEVREVKRDGVLLKLKNGEEILIKYE